jgi:hypothetical protein
VKQSIPCNTYPHPHTYIRIHIHIHIHITVSQCHSGHSGHSVTMSPCHHVTVSPCHTHGQLDRCNRASINTHTHTHTHAHIQTQTVGSIRSSVHAHLRLRCGAVVALRLRPLRVHRSVHYHLQPHQVSSQRSSCCMFLCRRGSLGNERFGWIRNRIGISQGTKST